MRGLGLRSSNRRKHSMAPPDLTFIFGKDVLEWDTYLSRQFEGNGVIIHHEQVENTSFPIPNSKIPVFSESRVVLVILSPDFLAFLDENAQECFEMMKLLKPNKTIAMLCGVTPANISSVKDVLVSYDDWLHLEAKDKDINMVRHAIELIQEMLTRSKENERLTKPSFKLVPRKVSEGNNKVYVILSKPIESNTQIKICLEANGVRDVPVKKRNPYTLVFIIPDDLLKTLNMVNVHVWCGEVLLGISQVKCMSKMAELYSLLASVASPYEFLCNTLGMATLHDVDEHLANVFKKNLPNSGFELFHFNSDIKYEGLRCQEEFPTLLHFAAYHGLCQLVKEILDCPGSQRACNLKNIRGLTPAQLANQACHHQIVALLDEFIKNCSSKENNNFDNPLDYKSTFQESTKQINDPTDCYDIPAQPIPIIQMANSFNLENLINEKENEYLKMQNSNKENIEFDKKYVFETDNKISSLENFMNKPIQNENIFTTQESFQSGKSKISLTESQEKLIKIMEAYKKGASLIEVEKFFNEWKALYQTSDIEAKQTLEGLRSLYAKAQKNKLSKKHSSSFSELRNFLNTKLRRKESLGSKSNLNRKHSKESNSLDKFSPESDANRPVSTLSVLSNTSSSSGSSFDRLSTASAGSDSGHHSDFCDDRYNKLKEKFHARYHHQLKSPNGHGNIASFQKTFQCLTLGSKPPAPPPRLPKPISRYGSIEDCKLSSLPHYAIAKKINSPSYDDSIKVSDYIQSDAKISESDRKFSFSSSDDPNANYDCPPPPRPNSQIKFTSIKSYSNSPPRVPIMDYDLVPVPLPINSSSKGFIPNSSEQISQAYDIPKSKPFSQFHRSNSLDYDFPKSSLVDNTDSIPTCTCQLSPPKNDAKLIKSCCMDNKLSMLTRKNSLPSVPCSDLNLDFVKYQPSITPTDHRAKFNQYYNVCLRPQREIKNEHRDSIPEEMAPPPPIEKNESPEEHYKLVGIPIPITDPVKD